MNKWLRAEKPRICIIETLLLIIKWALSLPRFVPEAFAKVQPVRDKATKFTVTPMKKRDNGLLAFFAPPTNV